VILSESNLPTTPTFLESHLSYGLSIPLFLLHCLTPVDGIELGGCVDRIIPGPCVTQFGQRWLLQLMVCNSNEPLGSHYSFRLPFASMVGPFSFTCINWCNTSR
jgi:hypothetical protein